MPVGHEMTTAGRHDDGGRTWLGLRRLEFISFIIGHLLILNIFAKVINNLPALQKMIFRPLRTLLSILKAIVFSYMAKQLYETAPLSLLECEETSSLESATALYHMYIAVCIADVATTFVSVLSGTHPSGALIRYPPTYWFWYLVVYYSPVGDMYVTLLLTTCFGATVLWGHCPFSILHDFSVTTGGSLPACMLP